MPRASATTACSECAAAADSTDAGQARVVAGVVRRRGGEGRAVPDLTGLRHPGGLVGMNRNKVVASYATGPVTGGGFGGLVGYNDGSVVAYTTNLPHWHKDVYPQAGDPDPKFGGVGKTTDELMAPRGYRGIYNRFQGRLSCRR